MIYLDHAATTPVHEAVLEEMLPFFSDIYGNPSSIHAAGRQARLALDRCRDKLAQLLECSPSELIFTGSGTESDNLAILGGVRASGKKGHIITSAIEHHAVLHTVQYLEGEGYEATYIEPDESGRIDPAAIAKALRPDTRLVSIMSGNNEVGTVQPIEQIGELVRSKGILFHSDAVQSLGNIPFQLNELPVDMVSFSAHKIGGPKGVGLLYVRNKTALEAIIHGGAQERKKRAGTENVAGIAGFTKAIELTLQNMNEKVRETSLQRDAFYDHLLEQLGSDYVVLNGSPQYRLPHILNVSFPGISSETMLMNLDLEGIAASSGSACTSGSLEPSHVLKAMRIGPARWNSAIRFSFGSATVHEAVTIAAKKTATIVKRLRK